MQWRMIATVVQSGGKMQTDLLPFGQTKALAKEILHVLSTAHELALEIRRYLIAFVVHENGVTSLPVGV